MSPYKTVAVAGATGNLGPAIVSALVAANFDVTVLSRNSSGIKNLPSTVKVAQVDFTSQTSLVSALKGIDAVVSAVPDASVQPPLIDAAIEAGVKRFLPSEFGSNSFGNEKSRALPVFAEKVKIQEYLKKRESEISYTFVINGAFLDWGIESGFLVNVKGGKNRIFDGGDRKSSMSLLSDVGKAVVGVLQHPEETKNRAVYVQSATVTQNELLALAKKHNADLRLEVEAVDLAELEKSSYEELQKKDGNVMQALFGGFIYVAIFGDGFGSVWEKTDNALLGIKELSEEELTKVVAKYT